MKKFIALGTAVLTLAIATVTLLLVHDTGPSGAEIRRQAQAAATQRLEQESAARAAAWNQKEIACISSGGKWIPRFPGGTCTSRFELEEEVRKEFCRGLPDRMNHADVPAKCQDFYGPVTTPPR